MITQPVATLAAAVLGAAFGGLLVFVLTRRNDHAVRLWERQIELYDEVLREARELELRREPGRPDGHTVTEADYRRVDDFKVRFDLIGPPAARKAYEEHAGAHRAWAGAAHEYASSLALLDDARAGIVPPHELAVESELPRWRTLARDRRAQADEAHQRLTAVLRDAAQHIPRLPHPRLVAPRRWLAWASRNVRWRGGAQRDEEPPDPAG